MKNGVLSRYALSSCVAAAMLAGCGGSQPPIGAPAMPQSRAIAQDGARGKSWMLADAKNSDLYYLAESTPSLSSTMLVNELEQSSS